MTDIFALFKKISKENDTPNAPITHLIVGLGNPGDKYHYTRHNAGFLMMDYLSQRCNAQINKLKFKSLVGEATVAGKRVLLMKPQTFMNASGEAVQQAAAFYKIPMENVLVFSDDVSLDVGRVRVRGKGSDGGQRGLRSIITIMNSDIFPRIRFGVGKKPHPDYDMADWVLAVFRNQDLEDMLAAAAQAAEAVITYVTDGPERAMNRFN